MRCLVLTIAALTAAQAQWTMQHAHTTAGLRGIHNIGGGVAWASGTEGTVVRTINDGQTWQTCAVPQEAEKLDFRGIQAFDENTAIVMSSGTGGLSRLYKTTDACRTWTLVFTNPDKTGFWDALQFSRPEFGTLIGDQVRGHFPVFFTTDVGNTWRRFDPKAISAVNKRQSIFAASNTALLVDGKNAKFYFVTGGGTTSLIAVDLHFSPPTICTDCLGVSSTHPDMASGTSAGGFSLASRVDGPNLVIVAVGGDYNSPDQTMGTAASWIDDHRYNGRWHASGTPPHGYRSAVAYYSPAKTWITVGPNGTDISTDDGRTWNALKPTAEETTDADKNWNALSLPFVAGPHGRIGKLSSGALSRNHD
jgi:hypothetical protein